MVLPFLDNSVTDTIVFGRTSLSSVRTLSFCYEKWYVLSHSFCKRMCINIIACCSCHCHCHYFCVPGEQQVRNAFRSVAEPCDCLDHARVLHQVTQLFRLKMLCTILSTVRPWVNFSHLNEDRIGGVRCCKSIGSFPWVTALSRLAAAASAFFILPLHCPHFHFSVSREMFNGS